VRRRQPEAVMFSDAGPDVRWCGNEKGVAGDPNWSSVDPASVPYPGASGPGVIVALQHGDPAGTSWRPAEADTSIRPGWSTTLLTISAYGQPISSSTCM
jgi:alpha-L-fucosidase